MIRLTSLFIDMRDRSGVIKCTRESNVKKEVTWSQKQCNLPFFIVGTPFGTHPRMTWRRNLISFILYLFKMNWRVLFDTMNNRSNISKVKKSCFIEFFPHSKITHLNVKFNVKKHSKLKNFEHEKVFSH